MVNHILKQMPAVGQPQRKFLVLLCSTILALRGRVNCRHLSRDWDDSERTIARQCRRSCDGPDVHHRGITTALDPQAEVLSAQDASCMPTSGQQPCGLGHFLNSGAGRAERGLELSPRAVVEGTHRGTVTRAVAQTPPPWATATKQDQEATLGDFDPQPRRAPHHRLPAWVASHAVDGDCAQKTYMEAGVDLRRHPSTKLRGDAEGRCLGTGPHPTRRGAHRQDDGKVHGQDLSRVEALGTLAEAAPGHLYPAVVWPVTRKRKRRVVVLIQRNDPAQPHAIVFASTALALDGHQRLELSGARVQIELWCRDSTQFTGLPDGQARTEAALSCPCQAALATRNLVRAEDLNAQAGEKPRVFSRARWKPGQFNARLLDFLIEKCALDPNGVKNHPSDDALRIDGAIAA